MTNEPLNFIPTECPFCGYSGIQTLLSESDSYKYNSFYDAYVVVTKCEHCKEATAYKIITSDNKHYARNMIVPISGKEEMNFPDTITKLSPLFTKTYSQANNAEKMNLNQIAGMGYRKALEYLVTDFLLKNDLATETETIKTPLSGLIKKIPEESIRDLALASTWIGNDETHYYRQNVEYGIEDIKEWIRALINYIEMKASIKRAHELVHKDRANN
ncbi:hypothetical protein [Lactiplantibacillus plantarum]|uniref:hypothetical protein n=1 Tax=Lactiplantibacillus plantarum TaxID=1590 RepID=UPI003F53E501